MATDLLTDLRDRGLKMARLLIIMDGARALRRAVQNFLGKGALVHRCQEHKIRNVLRYLPKDDHTFMERKLRVAYALRDAVKAQRELDALAGRLDGPHPGAVASLRDGLEETLTVMCLGFGPTLTRTLRSTNPIESMIEICRTKSRNVKRWRDGRMALPWAAAGMVEAQNSSVVSRATETSLSWSPPCNVTLMQSSLTSTLRLPDNVVGRHQVPR